MKRLTLEIIKERLAKINPNIEILSKEYINSYTKIRCRCILDNYEWDVTWSDLSKGHGCHVCARKNRRYNINIIKDKLNSINPNIEILSNEYIDNKSKLKCRCKLDGHIWYPVWGGLQQGQGCPKCAGKIKFTLDGIKEVLNEINQNIEIISEKYMDSHSKLKFRCKIDNHIWETTWNNLYHGKSGCPKCSGLIKLNIEIVKERLNKINPNIKILSDHYTNIDGKIQCECLIDGYRWKATSDSLLRGNGCKKCAGTLKLTIEEIKLRLKDINPNVEILSKDYINSVTKLNVKCNIDNYTWKASAKSLLKGFGCPKCNFSKGEKKIMEVLDNQNINYIDQHRFDECKDKKPLPFDFYLPDLNICIEYDGIQHYKPIKHFGGAQGLKNRKRKDRIKDEYCKINNIKLIRISYIEFDEIENILKIL